MDPSSKLFTLLGPYPLGDLGNQIDKAAQRALMQLDEALMAWAEAHPEVSEERCAEVRRELVKLVAVQLLQQI